MKADILNMKLSVSNSVNYPIHCSSYFLEVLKMFQLFLSAPDNIFFSIKKYFKLYYKLSTVLLVLFLLHPFLFWSDILTLKIKFSLYNCSWNILLNNWDKKNRKFHFKAILTDVIGNKTIKIRDQTQLVRIWKFSWKFN